MRKVENVTTAKCDAVKCPICGKLGQKVPNETVRHVLKSRNKKNVGEEKFCLCMNPDCDVAYFSSKSFFNKSALGTVMVQEGFKPKIRLLLQENNPRRGY